MQYENQTRVISQMDRSLLAMLDATGNAKWAKLLL